MANPIFVAQNTALYTLSATSTNASYPLTNLQDYVESTQWKSASLSNAQVLKIDFGAAASINSIVIGNHNFATIIASATEHLSLQYSDNDSDWSIAKTWDHPDADADPLYATFSVDSHRYWRLSFSTAGDLATYPAIGEIYLTAKFDIGAPYNYGFKDGLNQYATSEGIALNGLIRTSQQYGGGRKLWKIKWKSGNALSATNRTNWNTFFNLIQGKLRPFYFIDTDGTTIKYVFLNYDENPIEAFKYGLNELPDLVLRAAVVG